MEMRIERDSLGEMRIPADALYGAQTQRAVLNFPISGQRFPGSFIRAMGLIKKCNALFSKVEAGAPSIPWDLVIEAADAVMRGEHDDQFVVDVYQTGSGTSTNMNCNEVIARIASRKSGGEIHPNDHVNRGQSSNDVFPAAMHIAFPTETVEKLLPALRAFRDALQQKEIAFADVVKIGRTHLQDATPITLGQEFSGYRAQMDNSITRIETAMTGLYSLPLGGTAVGSGLNCPPERIKAVYRLLNQETGLAFIEAANHFEAQAARDAVVFFSGALRTLAVSLLKIANDIRWLGSGPRCGLGELRLPPTQPGSSIMPGKVNPVQAEALTMIAARVIGNDASITLAGSSGNFELNVMMPLMATSGLESITLLASGMNTFREYCVEGIEADRERCLELTGQSLALVTSLVPVLGYDRAAELAKEAYQKGLTIQELLLETKELAEETINTLLDPATMTGSREQ